MSIFERNRNHIVSSAFAFYDTQRIESENAQNWFNYCIQVSEKAGYPFDQGFCSPGNTKYVLIKNCRKIFEKNIESLSSMELRSQADLNEIGDYGHMFAYFCNDYRRGFLIGHQCSFNKNSWHNIGVELCKILRPTYAIFYEIPFAYSAEGYSSGYSNGLDINSSHWLFNSKHVDLSNRIKKWAKLTENSYDICSSGHLREIYPINFINELHLKYKVFSGTTLKDWIEADIHRGKVTQVTDELYSWMIADEDLEYVTIELAKSDILLCVNKENPQRYDYGVRPEDQIPIEPWHP